MFSKIDGYNKEYMIATRKEPFIHYHKEPCRVFVCCFSLSSDELMMWNYYSSRNTGCNIEFDIMYPSRSIGKKIEYLKSNVVYGEESEKVVREIVIQSFNVWKKMSERYRDSSIQIFLVTQLNALRPFLKNKAFKDEKEYRIILLVPENKIEEFELKFFNRGNLLIPYIEVGIENIDAEIKGIKLGPFAGNELNKYSVRDLLNSLGLREVSITLSDIPIRNYAT
jgi:hypothetical protein